MAKAIINLLALVGLCVAGYALYIEVETVNAEKAGLSAPSFFCDSLFTGASCSKAITGPYGKVLSLWGIVKKGSSLDVPNSLIGSLFYFLAITPWNANSLIADLFMIGGLLSLAFSAYLAYILRFVLHEFCIICVSSYVINILLFIFSARERMRMIKEEDMAKKTRKAK